MQNGLGLLSKSFPQCDVQSLFNEKNKLPIFLICISGFCKRPKYSRLKFASSRDCPRPRSLLYWLDEQEAEMNKRNVVAMLISTRSETAVNVQKILTGWGCMIKTRLGIHDGVLDNCTQTGLVLLEMVGEDAKIDEFLRKLKLVKGVSAKRITLELE
jgi:hypothetical protein